MDILLRGRPVLFVSSNSDIFLLPAGSQNEEASELYHQVAVVADEVYEYVEAMQDTPILHAVALKMKWKFHLLTLRPDESGKTAKGISSSPGLGIMAAGCQSRSLHEGDFQSAKQDFAVRSGLISKAQFFSPEQLTELYRATDFLLEEGPAPEEKHLRAIQEARTKIEYVVPDLQDRLEQGQEQEPQMNLDHSDKRGPYLPSS